MSQYEDALDESDFELRQLCTDAAKHINKRVALEQKQQQHKPLQKRVSSQRELHDSVKCLSSPVTNTGAVPTQCCTSSDGSSIEKIGGIEAQTLAERPEEKASSATVRKRTSQQKSEEGSSSTSANSNKDWKNINYEGEGQQPAESHQLHHQLKLLSSQLYEMETTNVLQLKLIYRILRLVFKAKIKRKNWRISLLPNWTCLTWLFVLCWPAVLQLISNYFTRRYYLGQFLRHHSWM